MHQQLLKHLEDKRYASSRAAQDRGFDTQVRWPVVLEPLQNTAADHKKQTAKRYE
jgi:hypothetical protein